MAEPLLTRAELAERLRVSERTLRRLLPGVPGLSPIRAGRTMLFTERDCAMVEEALRSPLLSASEGKSGTLAARSASAVKASKSASSAQARLREELQSKLQSARPRASGKKPLKVLQGGRAA